MFARGEYFFNQENYNKAILSFEKFLIHYKKPKEQLFALAFLYKLSLIKENKQLSTKLKKRIVTHKQIGLVFKKDITIKLTTPMNQNLKAIINIDKIEFYKNEELFIQLNY